MRGAFGGFAGGEEIMIPTGTAVFCMFLAFIVGMIVGDFIRGIK
jgi:hypothetical protein